MYYDVSICKQLPTHWRSFLPPFSGSLQSMNSHTRRYIILVMVTGIVDNMNGGAMWWLGTQWNMRASGG